MHPIEQSRQAILAYMQAQPPKSKVSSALENISNFAAVSGVGGILKAFASNAFSGQGNRQSAASTTPTAPSEGSLLKNTYSEVAPVAETVIRQHPWPALAVAALAGAGLVMSKPAQRQAYRLVVGSLGGSLAISSLLPKVLDLLQNRQK